MGAALAGLGKTAAQAVASGLGSKVASVDKIALVVRGGRVVYVTSAAWIGVSWYAFWRNQRVAPGDTKFPLPGRDKLAVIRPRGAADKADIPDVQAATGALADVPVIGKIGQAAQGPIRPPAGGPSPNLLLYLGHTAQRSFHLHVGEHPKFGGVHGQHSSTSLHRLGRAFDATGTVQNMAAFAQWVDQNYGAYVTELFWRGPHWVNIDNGRHQGYDYSGALQAPDGHKRHVHVGI